MNRIKTKRGTKSPPRRFVPMAVLAILLSACSALPVSAQVRWGGEILRQPREWYASAEARTAADIVIQYQSPEGGWTKNTDLLKPPSKPGELGRPTIDNNATTRPMRFLALVADATGDARYRQAFERGMDYLFAAQYPNGGWPQYFPLREGYYSRITYNDTAMVNVLTLLRDVGTGDAPYGFVDQARRDKASAAVERGIDVILRTQIKQDGQLTAWCAQHDEKTLEPAWARAYEPPSLSGGESVGIVRFLMSVEEPSPEIVAAIEGAVQWLGSVAMSGVRVNRVRRDDGRTERTLVKDPDAPPVWARFYELGTNRPLYLDRDSVYRYDFSEIGYERRSGYSYHGTWPAKLLDEDYPRWRAKNGQQ
jgi:PelA/Pel-15E family pectate lyase